MPAPAPALPSIPPRRTTLLAGWIGAWLVVLTVALYLPVLRHGFVALDDPDYVEENPMVRAGLSWAGVKWTFRTGQASNWHPLTWLSHQLDATLWGAGAAGPHAVNAGLHAANTLLVFLLLRRMTGALARSAFVAALFAWHPLHVESVAWIAERKDVLSGCFFLLTLLAYVRFTEAPSGAARAWYLAAVAAFAGGLMSKPMLVTTPCVLLLLDVWPLRRLARGGRAVVLEKLPFVALSIASCVVTFRVQQAGGAVRDLTAHPFDERVGNAVVSVVRYLGDAVWPAQLAIYYPHPGRWPVGILVGAVAIAAAVSAAAWRWRRPQPALLTGWLWFAGMLVPALGLVQVGEQARADRYTYLPLLGVFLAAVWLVADWTRNSRARRRLAVGVGGAALAAAAAMTTVQLRYWRDSVALFTRALEVTGPNFVAHHALGHHWLKEGKLDAAAAELERCLAVRPGFAEALNNLGSVRWKQGRREDAVANFRRAVASAPGFVLARGNLGTALLELGRADEAVTELQRAAAARPDDAETQLVLGNAHLACGRADAAADCYARAVVLRPGFADAHSNLGQLQLQAGRSELAFENFRRALAADPRHANARFNLAEAHRLRGELPAARAAYAAYLELAPDDADAHFTLGLVAQDLGEFRAAAEHLRRAVELRPADVRALAALGWLRATSRDDTLRDARGALELARRANELSRGGDPLVLRTLAAALAESGDYAAAETVARQALRLAQNGAAPALVPWLEPQVEQYAAGRPWREGAGATP